MERILKIRERWFQGGKFWGYLFCFITSWFRSTWFAKRLGWWVIATWDDHRLLVIFTLVDFDKVLHELLVHFTRLGKRKSTVLLGSMKLAILAPFEFVSFCFSFRNRQNRLQLQMLAYLNNVNASFLICFSKMGT